MLYYWGTENPCERNLDALVAQLDRVTGYEPVGQGFESLPARQRRFAFANLFCFFSLPKKAESIQKRIQKSLRLGSPKNRLFSFP